jgi:hypothetical protein
VLRNIASSLTSLTYTDQREKRKRYIIFTYLSGVLKTYHLLQEEEEEEERDKGKEMKEEQEMEKQRRRRKRNRRRRRGRRIRRGGGS